MNLLLFILVGVGLTNIIVNASILDGLKNNFIEKDSKIDLLISCMLCTGFWTGILLSYFFAINFLMGGIIISLFSSTYGKIIEAIEIDSQYKLHSIPELDDDELS